VTHLGQTVQELGAEEPVDAGGQTEDAIDAARVEVQVEGWYRWRGGHAWCCGAWAGT